MRMDIPWSRVMSYKVPIVGFTGKTIKLEGKVTLQVAIGDTVYMVEFLLFPLLLRTIVFWDVLP